jgi:protein disulfide-isomerase
MLFLIELPRRTPQTPEIKKQNGEYNKLFLIQVPRQFIANGTDIRKASANFRPAGNTVM